jgi:hypothetical protein
MKQAPSVQRISSPAAQFFWRPTAEKSDNQAISKYRLWPNDVRLSNIEQRFVCTACGKRGADARPSV